MKKKLIVLSGFVLASAPVMALAQAPITVNTGGGATCATAGQAGQIGGILCKIGDLLNIIIPILITLGVVYFIWGVIQYVIASDEEAKKSGRNRIIFGIIGLTIIVAMWGIVKILTDTFGIDRGTQQITYPTVR